MTEKILTEPEEIYRKIEEIYNTEKGKKFITHLIRSFFPIGKSDFIWEKKDKPIFCCITGIGLVSKDEAAQAMFDVTPEEFSKYMKKAFIISTEETSVEKQEPIVHPAIEKLDGKILGIESPESDKFICKEVYQQLYNFYVNKLLCGDSHINWLGKRMMADGVVKNLKSENKITPEEEKAVNKNINKPHKITLGDMGVLQQLKDKLEREEKK
jgi:hypothetical protein